MGASIYGDVSGASRKGKGLYGNVNGVNRKFKEAYAKVNGVVRKVYSSAVYYRLAWSNGAGIQSDGSFFVPQGDKDVPVSACRITALSGKIHIEDFTIKDLSWRCISSKGYLCFSLKGDTDEDFCVLLDIQTQERDYSYEDIGGAIYNPGDYNYIEFAMTNYIGEYSNITAPAGSVLINGKEANFILV